jgi:acetyltransferase-like isoleucine patch superfamily enzyme
MNALKRLFRYLAHRHNCAVGFYRRLCRPKGDEWAEYLRVHGGLHSMGRDCFIEPNVTFTDPAYTSLGNNVRLSGCIIFGHDGSVNMLNRAHPGLHLDNVGPVVIGDNVFIGHGAIILAGTRVGDNVIIAAGAKVSGVVRDNAVMVPPQAVELCSTHELLAKVKTRSDSYPWHPLVAKRASAFDPLIQPALDQLRIEHWEGAGELPMRNHASPISIAANDHVARNNAAAEHA